MNISKLHWRYAHEAYTINAFIGDQWLSLRVCAHGYDENDEIRHTLYCTADGRFFHKRKVGWREVLPAQRNGRKKKHNAAGGSYDFPFMRNFTLLRCHQLVCTAFYGLKPDGYECDHINGNHQDWTANNLEWVRPEVNRRRAKYANRLRNIGISPKLLSYRTLKEIYKLNAEEYDRFLEKVKYYIVNDPSPLSAVAIERDVIIALQNILYSRNTN